MNVGFVGLGRMGSGMAGRILEAGHDLTVFDVLPQNTAKVAAAVRARFVAADLCAGRDVVITMLAEEAAVDAVVFGQGVCVIRCRPVPFTWRWEHTGSRRFARSSRLIPPPDRPWSRRRCSARTSPRPDSSASSRPGLDALALRAAARRHRTADVPRREQPEPRAPSSWPTISCWGVRFRRWGKRFRWCESMTSSRRCSSTS